MPDLVLSLFPGIGLLDMAFEEEGFVVVRGPDLIWGGDIRTFHPPAGKFDGIIGGPPCQCFSALANLVRANGYEPKFGNLIPEYERCVKEAEPRWFLMEEVVQAPVPVVPGYGVRDFILNNAWLGEEQMRRRRFSFGVRGGPAPLLMKWIEQAPLELPQASHAIVSDLRDVPVKIGGSGKVKCSVVSQNPVNNSQEAKGLVQHVALKADPRPTRREARRGIQSTAVTAHMGGVQNATVTAAHSGEKRPKGGKLVRYHFADACRLQGLPENFLEFAPFTAQGKLKAVANGVPLSMGRAVARAVKAATEPRR